SKTKGRVKSMGARYWKEKRRDMQRRSKTVTALWILNQMRGKQKRTRRTLMCAKTRTATLGRRGPSTRSPKGTSQRPQLRLSPRPPPKP
ncbi:UNVERIFIED_CONTAM: hypothetical protein K2H54_002615, partial [Gekko kuhli]